MSCESFTNYLYGQQTDTTLFIHMSLSAKSSLLVNYEFLDEANYSSTAGLKLRNQNISKYLQNLALIIVIFS